MSLLIEDGNEMALHDPYWWGSKIFSSQTHNFESTSPEDLVPKGRTPPPDNTAIAPLKLTGDTITSHFELLNACGSTKKGITLSAGVLDLEFQGMKWSAILQWEYEWVCLAYRRYPEEHMNNSMSCHTS